MAVIRLKKDVFNKITKTITNEELAKRMKISSTQLWRIMLPDEDSRHNDPGENFIAGLLASFPEIKFEDIFYLE